MLKYIPMGLLAVALWLPDGGTDMARAQEERRCQPTAELMAEAQQHSMYDRHILIPADKQKEVVEIAAALNAETAGLYTSAPVLVVIKNGLYGLGLGEDDKVCGWLMLPPDYGAALERTIVGRDA